MTREEFIETVKNSPNLFKRVNNDINGNPRYVFHFLYFLSDAENEKETLKSRYEKALKNAKSIGGYRQYRGKDFGGGFVTQSYNLDNTIGEIWDLQNRK